MNLDKVVGSVRDLLKKEKKAIEVGNGLEHKVSYWVSSGSYSLDWAISGRLKGGGWPGGKVVDLFGDPSTGKSLLLYHLLGNVQKQGGVAVLDDPEWSYDSFFAELVGVDNKQLLYLNPPSHTVEEHFLRLKKVVGAIRASDKTCPIIYGLDSIAKLTTEHEVKTEYEKRDMTKAQAIHKGLRLYSGLIYTQEVLYIVSNHVISNIGGYGGRSTPGGVGFPFECSVRVCLDYMGKIKDENDKVVGVKTKASIPKNRCAPPHKEVTIDIYFDRGVDPVSGLGEVLIQEGIIEKSGSWLKHGGKSYHQVAEILKAHPEILGG